MIAPMSKAIVRSLIYLTAAIAVSCAGQKAREHVLLPAMRQAWPGVKEDAERGLVLAPEQYIEPGRAEIAAMEAALESGATIRVALAAFELTPALAMLAINDMVAKNEIAIEVANSLVERLVQFDNAHKAMSATAREEIR